MINQPAQTDQTINILCNLTALPNTNIIKFILNMSVSDCFGDLRVFLRNIILKLAENETSTAISNEIATDD
jgi:hypothetical protein